MRTLYENARSFIYRNARPLDFARWQYHFEGGSPEAVVNALAAYQNPDGGFGHGLEADCLNPTSSPIQTWAATMILREIDLYAPDHPVVSGIVRYLESGADFDGRFWAWAIPSNNDHPHAPWWTYMPPSSDNMENDNPTASLVGWLLRVTGSSFAKRLAREAIAHYLSLDSCTDMHLLPCYLTLYRDICTCMPESLDILEFEAHLRRDITACVTSAADSWNSYCAYPSDFILNAEDPFCACFPELIERECRFIADTQLKSGAWPITWHWNDYPDAFAVSANWWQSHFIIEKLLFLREMGKLDWQ